MKRPKLIGLVFSLVLLFWLSFFSYTDSYHYSIGRNLITGEVWISEPSGMSISSPWTQISRIDIRPIRSCIDCSCNNINCKLISFNPNGYLEFIEKEGFEYYWWRNRFSFNYGNKFEYRGLSNILRGYSFDEIQYGFLTIEK